MMTKIPKSDGWILKTYQIWVGPLMPQRPHLAVDWLLKFPQTPAIRPGFANGLVTKGYFQHDSHLEYGDSQHIFQCFRGARSRKTQWVWAGSFIANLYIYISWSQMLRVLLIYCYYCGGPTGKAPNSWLFIVHSHPFLVISFGDGALLRWLSTSSCWTFS